MLLQPGKRITVRTTAAAGKFSGRLHSATPEGITLIGKDGTRQTFAKTEVTLVRLRGSNAWPFVGAAAASAYPATVLFREKGPYLDMSRDIATIALPVFAVGGALIGKVVQRSTRKTVYDVRP